MAPQPASVLPPTADKVGNQFVSLYYNILYESPDKVHKFYTDASHITRGGFVSTPHDDCKKKEILWNLNEFKAEIKAEIKTTSFQESHLGGVLVLVTGTMSNKSNGKRNFVQSFFLAPQEDGYFVLNDIFRYLDDKAFFETKSTASLCDGLARELEIQTISELEIKETASPLTMETITEEIFDEPEFVDGKIEELEGPSVVVESDEKCNLNEKWALKPWVLLKAMVLSPRLDRQ